MRERTTLARIVIAAAAVASGAPVCLAQDDAPAPSGREPRELPPPESDLSFSVATGLQYIFNTDLDDSGDFDVRRAAARLGYETRLERDIALKLSLKYIFDDYDISNSTALGPSPWSDIHTLAINAIVEWWMTSDAALFAGPAIVFARESGAGWEDSFYGGAVFGAMFVSSPKLVWGAGLGVLSQIEDDPVVYPVIILEWAISDRMRLSSGGGPIGLGTAGVEFIYDLGRGFEVGAGLRYEFRRFRLDGSGVAPNGVGEDKGFPIWLRLSYTFNPNFVIDLYGGAVFGGEFTLESSSGALLGTIDYDLAPTAAATVRIRF